MTDWTLFLNNLLDGTYALDVRKMGSHVMFAKNRLGSELNLNTEGSNLRASLRELISSKTFDVKESLQQADTYNILFDLGIEFIGGDNLLAKNCSALYLKLRAYSDKLNEESLRCKEDMEIKCCLVIIKFIEHWKNMYEIIGDTNIYKQHLFLEKVSNNWKEEIGLPGLNNPLVVMGLVYLNEWRELPKKRIEIFFKHSVNNQELFGSIMSDLLRVEGNRLYNYFSFVQSCKMYFQRFYQVVGSRMPFWTDDEELQNSDTTENDSAAAVKNQFDEYAKNLAMDGLLDKEKLAQSVAESIKKESRGGI